MKENLSILEKQLGYDFEDKNLLIKALTPSTKVFDQSDSNELLEFLGDRVLGLTLADLLQTLWPKYAVGELNDEYVKLVRNDAVLKSLAQNYGLDKYTGKSGKKSLADTMEALIGAIFLDSKRDYSLVKAFVAKHWAVELGFPEPDILPFYIIKKYDDKQLIEGLLKLGLDANAVCKLNEENQKLYSEIRLKEFRQGFMDSVLDDIMTTSGLSAYDDGMGGRPFNILDFIDSESEIKIKKQLKIEKRDFSGVVNKNLLYVACNNMRTDIAKLLIKYGAIVDEQCTSMLLCNLQGVIESYLENGDSDDEVKKMLSQEYMEFMNDIFDSPNLRLYLSEIQDFIDFVKGKGLSDCLDEVGFNAKLLVQFSDKMISLGVTRIQKSLEHNDIINEKSTSFILYALLQMVEKHIDAFNLGENSHYQYVSNENIEAEKIQREKDLIKHIELAWDVFKYKNLKIETSNYHKFYAFEESVEHYKNNIAKLDLAILKTDLQKMLGALCDIISCKYNLLHMQFHEWMTYSLFNGVFGGNTQRSWVERVSQGAEDEKDKIVSRQL